MIEKSREYTFERYGEAEYIFVNEKDPKLPFQYSMFKKKVYAMIYENDMRNDAGDEYFGFTDAEVRNLLQYYELVDHYDIVKEWYDGYRFGNIDVYCPWDILNYCDTLRNTSNGGTGG